jgi:hypothetical protein
MILFHITRQRKRTTEKSCTLPIVIVIPHERMVKGERTEIFYLVQQEVKVNYGSKIISLEY